LFYKKQRNILKMKKILLSFSLATAVGFTANAQATFTLEHKEMSESTLGADPSSSKDDNSITFYNHVQNTSGSPITNLKWSIAEVDFPFGWSVWTICDNNICYPQNQVNQIIAGNLEVDFFTIDADTNSLLKPQIWVPTSGDNGTGVLKIRVFDPNHSDTAIYMVNKTPVGVNTVKIDDNRVAIFPNPGTANAMVNVFVNKALNAKEFVVVNVLGAQVAHQAIKGEVSTLATANLAQGNYLIKILDQSGNVITTRKWAK